jgi:hypothetical protein
VRIIAIWLISIIVMAMLSCDHEGGGSREPTAINPDIPPLLEGTWYRPAVGVSWQWQLSREVNTTYAAELYDIDLFDTPQATIDRLQAQKKRVICYFSAGSYEAYRPDAWQFHEEELGAAIDGFPDERWLDIRSANVIRIMRHRLDLAHQKHCDGVELDNVDGYSNDSGFNLTAQDQLAFNRLMANEAHARGLSVALKNDLEQVVELVDYFDFSINEQCHEFDECDLLAAFIASGKPVLNAEYQSPLVRDASLRAQLCEASDRMQFSTLVLPVTLDDAFRLSCQ